MNSKHHQRQPLPSQIQPAVVIPVFNHGRQIKEVIHQALKQGFPVFVVNDGSTDSTAKAIEPLEDITVLHHPVNLGKGAALLTGLAAAYKRGCNVALTIDGDGQHDPEDVWSLLNQVKDEKRCIVVGSRQGMVKGKNVPWTSRFGKKFSNFWVWTSGGPPLEDSQSGFRLYPLPETLELEVKARRYQFEVEVLVKAKQRGIIVKEAPVRVIYQTKGERVSHFRPWLDFWRNSTTFSRLIFARIFRIFGS
jgi:glycosyltransferase involved in cell wall biosynthesis